MANLTSEYAFDSIHENLGTARAYGENAAETMQGKAIETGTDLDDAAYYFAVKAAHAARIAHRRIIRIAGLFLLDEAC